MATGRAYADVRAFGRSADYRVPNTYRFWQPGKKERGSCASPQRSRGSWSGRQTRDVRPTVSRILIALALIRRSGHPGGGGIERRERDRVFARRRWRRRRDATAIVQRERTGWPRGRPCHGDCYRIPRRGTHNLPNDRSVDAMLDHPWIICRSSARRIGEKRERRKGEKSAAPISRSDRRSIGTAALKLQFLFRSRDLDTQEHTTLRHVNGDGTAREKLTTHTVAARRKTGDGTPRNADPSCSREATAASRRGVRAN